MNCKICGKENSTCFSSKILKKYSIKYYHCKKCDFIQTEEPYWLDEAYSRSINLSDTGYMSRNIFYSKRVSILLYLMFGKNGVFLDYAGGYGVFVRLMRDIGFNFILDDKYTENLFAGGFEWDKKKKVNAITLFEVFEHFVDPINELENLLTISDTIIFSTDLHPDPIPKPENWGYFGLDHGQHISFYSKNTFNYIADKYNLNYYNDGSFHILTSKTVSKLKLFSTKLSKLGFHHLVKRSLNSKTLEDHATMINKVKE